MVDYVVLFVVCFLCWSGCGVLVFVQFRCWFRSRYGCVVLCGWWVASVLGLLLWVCVGFGFCAGCLIVLMRISLVWI